eukprot:GHRQ01021934.1.p3 GENE.GHRQ01021934.1~~GHRQ01021934.1.p3  ORF type:complete len:145 (-),score=63.35 GHRQ01021934.1:405-839(-)
MPIRYRRAQAMPQRQCAAPLQCSRHPYALTMRCPGLPRCARRADDVQVSFVMLDPYVRQPMAHDGAGRFSLRFKVPDVYGVFKYVIDYKHAGYSYINLQQVVPVRPFKHDEYERFLVAAYPYYASVASTMAAFFLLGFAFLYSR